MKKKFFIYLLVLSLPLFAYPSLPQARTEDEALFVRRIVEFWRTKEYTFAKTHIQTYLQNNSDSPFTDHFYAMLGDIAMHHKTYREAITLYEKIDNENLKEEVQIRRWRALYQMQCYMQLYQEILPLVSQVSEEGLFYFCEAAFREALALLPYREGKEHVIELCEEALPLYTSLANSKAFGSHAKLAMAEIYRLLEQPKEAAKLYLDLSKVGDDEEILFHAGAMLAQCNTEKAITIFEKLTRKGNSRTSSAAYQWLQLLAKERQWEKIAEERDLFLSHLDQTQLPIGYFYLGMIAHGKNQFHQAISDLSRSIEGGIKKPHDKKALLILMASAKELEKIDVCETNFNRFKERYPDEMGEISFLKAMTYFKAQQNQKALALFEEIIQAFPDEEVAQLAYIQRVYLLMGDDEWGRAHSALLAFLNNYPHSPQRGEMIRLAINLSLNQLDKEEVYGQLAEDIERGLQAHLFDIQEEESKKEILARAYIKLGLIEKAIALIDEMEAPDPLLLCQYYLKEGCSFEKVIEYGERAIGTHKDPMRLHLHLFNAYLELIQNNPDELLTQKAAEHLHEVINVYPVSLKNRLWLTNYFVKQKHSQAIPLLETLLQTETNWKRFDGEALILAQLYQENNQTQVAESILEKIIALKQATQWKALLALAELYHEKEEVQKALPLYQKLEGCTELSVAHKAQLQLARLNFSTCPEQSLEKLNSLKRRKVLSEEPIHLEAALDYASLSATLLPAIESKEKLLDQLLQIEDEFTQQKDIWSKDYHSTRALMPEKDLTYRAYMRYLEAWICSLQGQLTNNRVERREKTKRAHLLFSSLCEGKYAVSKYLVEKATDRMYDQ